ncbi:MAG TPA: methyltransferase domain-containing protein [Verrucomicrobiae bacterium]|nr:methyltransferase domain-containing protein [Verrucomicrobiae bacterium]
MSEIEGLGDVAKSYDNRMRSQRAQDVLEKAFRAGQRILDVGGGIAPFHGATHVLDILPYDDARLAANAWGSVRKTPWTESEYTQFDCCDSRWPLADQSFDLGCCLGMIEDVRDPIFIARELQRVCRKVLIETPSRLFEQTVGADHMRYAGFWHHRWMLFERDGALVCRRKTPMINLPGCHFKIRPWQRLDPRHAHFTFLAESPFPVIEEAAWSDDAEFRDLAGFVKQSTAPPTIFIREWRGIVYRLRQAFLGSP